MIPACERTLPKFVRMTDLTLRDGLQNLKTVMPTRDKLALADALAASGIQTLEATSFVNAKAVPQMFDAAKVVAHMQKAHPGVASVVLVPNIKGAALASEHSVGRISYVMSASAGHSKANLNRTREESLADLARIAAQFPSLDITLSLSTVFGCPFDGRVPVQAVLDILERAVQPGVGGVTLCDTIGVACPTQVEAVIGAVRERFATLDIGVHFHDTHGMALANVYAALRMGIDRIEASAGGLGGCPFAPGAAGNASMEDCLNMLWRMGIETGVDFDAYMRAVTLAGELTGAPLPGHMAKARTYREFAF